MNWKNKKTRQNKHIPYIIVSSFQVQNIPQEQYKIKLLRVDQSAHITVFFDSDIIGILQLTYICTL